MYDDVIILGDFNLDLKKRVNSGKINKIAKQNNLHQLIKDNTRITNVSHSILDLIFITKPDKMSVSGVHSLGHSLIYLIHKKLKN